jgi:hypothetical protein
MWNWASVSNILISLGAALAFIALPAVILIANRDNLSRRWFGDGDDAGLSVCARELLHVGLVLIAVERAWMGIEGLLGAAAISVTLHSASGETHMSEAFETLRYSLGSITMQAVVNLVLGLSLLRLAKPLSEHWLQRSPAAGELK